MKYYKLKEGVLSVGALKNKIFRSTDKGVYSEKCWKPGTAEALVKQGYLVLVTDEPKDEKVIDSSLELPKSDDSVKKDDESKTDSTADTEGKNDDEKLSDSDELKEKTDEGLASSDDDEKNKKLLEDPSGLSNTSADDSVKEKFPAIDEISVEDIILKLIDKGITFDENSTKTALYDLWVNS
jgi:hypothetical protein